MWFFASVLFSLTLAAYMLINQRMKMPADIFVLWRCAGVCLLLAPVLPFIALPEEPLFYVFSLLTGVVVGYNDGRILEAARRYGAGPLSRIVPLEGIFTFFLWGALHPYRIEDLINAPLWRSAGVITAIFGAGLAMLLFGRGKTGGRDALIFLFPAVLMLAVQNYFHKSAADYAESNAGAVLTYAFTGSFGAGAARLAYLLIAKHRNKPGLPSFGDFFTRPALTGAALITPVVFLLMATKNIAMSHTPDPSYVVTTGFLSVLWVGIYNRITRTPDRSDVRAGMIFVLSAALLALCA